MSGPVQQAAATTMTKRDLASHIEQQVKAQLEPQQQRIAQLEFANHELMQKLAALDKDFTAVLNKYAVATNANVAALDQQVGALRKDVGTCLAMKEGIVSRAQDAAARHDKYVRIFTGLHHAMDRVLNAPAPKDRLVDGRKPDQCRYCGDTDHKGNTCPERPTDVDAVAAIVAASKKQKREEAPEV